MRESDWILIAFTILAQMSVGAFLVLGVVHYYASRKGGQELADQLSDRALLAIGPVMVLGMIASLYHLGSPLNAYLAVTNLGASWLSREVLAGVVFTVLGGLFALMQWRKLASFTVRNLLAWLAAIAGLILVWSMSNVYMLPAQPVWNTVATPILFYTTTLLLGALAVGVAFVANYRYLKNKEGAKSGELLAMLQDALGGIAAISIVALGVHLVVLPLQLAYLAFQGGGALQGAQMMYGEYGVILFLRLVLVFVGAGVFGIFLFQNAKDKEKEQALCAMAYAAFVVVLVAEVLGRFLFYAPHIRIGI
jgi:anaerobic dimethyl sulfoxide reductase subunit C